MKQSERIIIVGAGACGFMAARELSKAGKEIRILEARDRIGGRIWELPAHEFGFAAEGGAEFVHGEAPITRQLMKEAGLTYVSAEPEMWSVEDGKLVKFEGSPMQNPEIMLYKKELEQKLKALEKDLPIAEFLEKNFGDEKHAPMRDWMTRMAQGFDAADPARASTFALRDEWLGGEQQDQGKIKEGYGALINFLAEECRKNGVGIDLNCEVTTINWHEHGASITCKNGATYEADRVILTVPLALLRTIRFTPDCEDMFQAADRIGYGSALKILLRFKHRWWLDANPDAESMSFLFLENERIPTWWTQSPEQHALLTGWVGGPNVETFKKMSDAEIVSEALEILGRNFGVERKILEEELVTSIVGNWLQDSFARGAYSYVTPETAAARKTLAKPLGSSVYFAGEALYVCDEAGTVEAALGSGKEVAGRIK